MNYGKIRNLLKTWLCRYDRSRFRADAVTVHESNEFIERMENGDKYMTNSCCPDSALLKDSTLKPGRL